MQKSDIKIGIDNFFNEIKFDENHYSLYNNILNERRAINQEIFFFIILQACLQTSFYGYFDELYIDVLKRKNEYIREILKNFKEAAIDTPTYYNKMKKFFCLCGKMTEKELLFSRQISLFDIDNVFNKYFSFNNDEKKNKFITQCEKIYNNIIKSQLDEKVNLESKVKTKNKTKKRVTFFIT